MKDGDLNNPNHESARAIELPQALSFKPRHRQRKSSNWDLYFLVGLGAACIMAALVILSKVTH